MEEKTKKIKREEICLSMLWYILALAAVDLFWKALENNFQGAAPEVIHCITACIWQHPFYPEITGVIIYPVFSPRYNSWCVSWCQGEPECVITPDHFNSQEILCLCNLQTALLFGWDNFLFLLVICISVQHLRID